MAHKYKRIKQKIALCGPACFQMILQRRGLQVLDQEQIALETGTKVEEQYKHFYSVDLPTTTNPKQVGLWLHEYERMNRLVEKYSLPLRVEQTVYVSRMPGVKKFIEENLAQDNDIIANMWMRMFYRGEDHGHFLVVESMLPNGAVIFCDPNPQNPPYMTASLDKVIKSMGTQFDGKERGFVVVKSS
jgi:hypothetical protein